jgi:Ca2+-binding RTX toxin-like protein
VPRPSFCESLELRVLLAANLAFDEFVAGIGPVIRTGATTGARYSVRNAGDFSVTPSFIIQYKLVPIPKGSDGSSADYYAPGSVIMANFQLDDDLPPLTSTPLFAHTFPVPAGLIPGQDYAWMIHLDDTNVVAESNESDNYIVHGVGTAVPADGIIRTQGTSGNDVINITLADQFTQLPKYRININGANQFWPIGGELLGFDFTTLGGDDIVNSQVSLIPVRVDTGDGNDRILGGSANDMLIGGAGKDQLDGGGGNDRLNGNGGNDKLIGGAGADRLYGYAGNDILDGGSSNDRLEGGAGLDTLWGQSGNDRFFTADGETDQLFGGSGNDTAQADAQDLLSSVTRV